MSVGISLIGAGRIGRIHASNVDAHPDARLRYVVDVDAGAARELAERFACAAADIDGALGDPRVDAVIIASSTDTHLPLIAASARAGKAIFCEKPLDLDVDNARECVRLASGAGVPLYVGFNRRYDPSMRRLHDDIVAGSIGRVEVVSITSRDPAPPPMDYVRRSGGLFRDMTIHDLDMARWLLGLEPESVFASGSCLIDEAIAGVGDVDTATLILRSETGSFCQITNSRRCVYGYDQRIEVFASDGMLRVENDTETRVERAGAEGFRRDPAMHFFLERYREAYRLQIDDLVRALSGDSHGLADGNDGLQALRLAEAADRSMRTRLPISLDSIE